MNRADPAPRPTWLARLGLDRPELRAWALYDCANSAAVTTIVTAVYPIYFGAVAARDFPEARATQIHAWFTTAALLVVAVLSPVLGAVADLRPWKKRLLAAFAGLGIAGTAALALVGPGAWLLGASLFLVVNVGLNGSFVFYDALLPHVAREDELDRVSSAGYAIGYLGGGLLLAAQLLFILKPAWFGVGGLDANQRTQIVFVSVAVWWALFTIPLLRRVPEPRAETPSGDGRGPVVQAFARLAATFRHLRRYRQALLMLGAFLLYNDGIGTIIRMAAIYGRELHLGQGTLVGAILLVQLIGVPAAFAFAGVAGRLGAKRAILAGLAVYALVAVLAYETRTAAHFWALAVLVGLVQGGTQALSRSLFASFVPRRMSGEFFGFFSVSEKAAGILGPLVFGLVSAATGSSRGAVLSVIAFFVAGGALLAAVDVARGRREAEEGDGALPTSDGAC